MQDLKGIRENSSWSGVHCGISTNQQQFITPKPNVPVSVSRRSMHTAPRQRWFGGGLMSPVMVITLRSEVTVTPC